MTYTEGYFLELKNGIVSNYLKEFNVTRLSKKEEYELFIRYKNGDKSALNEIFESNLWLVFPYARIYEESGFTFDDLFQAGAIGLINAIEKFDVNRGNRFTAYANKAIKISMNDLFSDESRIVHIQREMFWLVYNYNNFLNEFLVGFGRVPTKDEVKEEFDLTENEFRCLEKALYEYSVFSDLYGEDKEKLGLISDDDIIFDDDIYKEMLVSWSSDVLKMINGQNADIIKYRFGLDGVSNETFRQLSDRFGLNFRTIHSRVKKICKVLRQIPVVCSQLEYEYEMGLSCSCFVDNALENEFFEVCELCNFTSERMLIALMLFGKERDDCDVNKVCKLECLSYYSQTEKLDIINDVIDSYVRAYKQLKLNKRKHVRG